MKKKALSAALAAAFVLTTAGTVFADPVEFNGKITYQHRENTADGSDDISTNRWQFFLNGTAPEVAKNIDLYFRIAGEKFKESGRDFEVFPGQDKNDRSVFALDQFGFNYKNAGWNYKLGRQSSLIGATGIIYDSTSGIGKHIFADGLTITGKTGATNVTVAALEDDGFYNDGKKIYYASASFKPAEKLTLGGTFARATDNFDLGEGADGTKKDLNLWAVNAAYDINSKVNVYGEYVKSNADTDDKAYAFGGSYSFDSKNSFWAAYSRVETNANIRSSGNSIVATTFDDSGKGMYYGFDHQFDKTTGLSFFYKDMKDIASGDNYTSFRTTVTYKF